MTIPDARASSQHCQSIFPPRVCRMHSVVTTHHHQQVHIPKKSLKSVLGFGALSLREAAPIRGRSSVDTYRPPELFSSRASIDTARNFQPKRKSTRTERSGVTNVSSFFRDSLSPSSTSSHHHGEHASQDITDSSTSVRSMNTTDIAPHRAMRRQPVRIDAQEGPWTISVAETPHDSRSYSIYIKSAFIFLPCLRLSFRLVHVCTCHFQITHSSFQDEASECLIGI